MKIAKHVAPLVTALPLLMACGQQSLDSPAVVAPVPAPVASVQPSQTVPELTPVEAPANLVAAGRVRAPAAVLDTLLGWSAFPVDWRSFLRGQGARNFEVFDFDAPIEVAVLLGSGDAQAETETLEVVSIGLKSMDQALESIRAEGIELSELSPGTYRVGGSDEWACAISDSLGPTPARAVCGRSEEALEKLLPYAARGLPIADLGSSDLALHLYAEPWRERFAPTVNAFRGGIAPWLLGEYSLDHPKFDRALANGFHGLMKEAIAAFETVDHISFLANVDAAKHLMRFDASLVLKRSDTVLSRTVEQLARRAGLPPEGFWGLPGDSTIVTWQNFENTEAQESLKMLSTELVEGYLEHLGVKHATVVPMRAAVGLLFSALSSGFGAARFGPAEPSEREARQLRGAYSISQSPDEVERGVDAWMRLAASPQFKQAEAARSFNFSKRKLRVEGVGNVARYELKWTRSLRQPVPPRGEREANPPKPRVLLVYGSAGQSWVVVAQDFKLASAYLRTLVKRDGSTLEGEHGLAPLRDNPSIAAGAVRARDILAAFRDEGVAPRSAQTEPNGRGLWIPYTCSARSTDATVELLASLYLDEELFVGLLAALVKDEIGSMMSR